jgi:hypothetical protein
MTISLASQCGTDVFLVAAIVDLGRVCALARYT